MFRRLKLKWFAFWYRYYLDMIKDYFPKTMCPTKILYKFKYYEDKLKKYGIIR